MSIKIFVVLCCIAVVSAGLLPAGKQFQDSEDHDGHPSYTFNYEVQDSSTGDFKSQSETRNGDVVQGQYSLHDADGYRRIVDYSSDDVSGFKASVRREPLSSAEVPVLKSYSLPTLVQNPSHTLIHGAQSVHFATAANYVHAAPSVTLQKAIPTSVITHHAPAIVHSSIATPHYQFVI